MVEVKQFILGEMGTNCYLFYDGERRCAIVDCEGDGSEIQAFISQQQLKVEAILLTHGHFDHTGAVQVLRAMYHCPVYAGEKERAVLADPKLNLSIMLGESRSFEADCWVKEGDCITVGSMQFHVLETPGHTEGSVCYRIESYLVAGDTLFYSSCGRVDFPTGDMHTMRQSLQKLAALEGDFRVLPGHERTTTLQRERDFNPYMQ